MSLKHPHVYRKDNRGNRRLVEKHDMITLGMGGTSYVLQDGCIRFDNGQVVAEGEVPNWVYEQMDKLTVEALASCGFHRQEAPDVISDADLEIQSNQQMEEIDASLKSQIDVLEAEGFSDTDDASSDTEASLLPTPVAQ